jgi:ligand-binding sensor domain-containing protein
MRVWIICFLTFFNINLFGQEFFFKNFGTDQGLPSSETYHSLQDSKGFIWITTDAGICRYDGKTFTTFTTKDGLPENVVFNVYEDRHGRVWFSSLSGNIFYYEKGRFKNIEANASIKKMSLGISSFFVGEHDTLFLSISDQYFLKISPENNYTKIALQKIKDCELYFLVNKFKNNELMIGTNNSELGHKNSLDLIIDYPNNRKKFEIQFDHKIREKRTNCSRSQINKFQDVYLDCANKLVVIRYSDKSIEYYDSSYKILFAYPDKFGNLWIGTIRGCYFFSKSNLKSKPIYFLKDLSISDIMIDNENNVWICSLHKGIFKSINYKLFDIFYENDQISNFYKEKNDLFIGFDSKQIAIVTKNDSMFFPKPIEILPKQSALQYFATTEKSSYFGTSEGLYFVKNKKITQIPTLQRQKNPYIISKKIISIGKDSFAVISTFDIYFVTNEKNFDQIHPPFIVKSIIQLKNKSLLIGSRNSDGVYQLKNGVFIPYFKQDSQLKTRINNMIEDANGNLWIATNERGLFCYSKNKLYEYNQVKGMNSNKINELDIDKNGTVWVATNKGINKITISNGLEKAMIQSFNETHGLPNLEVEHLTVFNDKVWCSTKEHLFYFECDKMIPNLVHPYVYIKSISINDSSVSMANSPILKYDQNNITFEFTGLTYKSTEKREFLYRMIGYQPEWKSSITGQTQYTNLPNGDYTFEVVALNNDKVKSVKPAVFHFTILKPLWLTWWFIIIEIILLIIAIYLFISWRINKIKTAEKEKTLINQKLAEFQMTALRAQMNPHFVFNAISSIQHYILTNDKYNSYDYLAKFSKLIRNVLDNSQEEYITLEKEIITLSLYVELEKIRFKVPFDFSLKVNDELDQSDILIPTMLIQPYIENAIWHGLMPKQNDCLLELIIEQKGDNLVIIIADNGVGRRGFSKPKNKNHVSKAMGLTDQRIKALSVSNNATFTVEIIDLKTEEDLPVGTEVKIMIPLLMD